MSRLTQLPSKKGLPQNWVEFSVAVCAVIISSASLFIATRQNSLMERQLSASTWPVLEFGTSNLDEQGNPEIALQMKNAGIGPARIRSFTVLYDGQPVANAHELVEACCSSEQPVPKLSWIVSGLDHAVLTANEEVRFLRLKLTAENQILWHELDVKRFNINLHVCYCSALQECWMLNSVLNDPQTTDACPAPRETQFRG